LFEDKRRASCGLPNLNVGTDVPLSFFFHGLRLRNQATSLCGWSFTPGGVMSGVRYDEYRACRNADDIFCPVLPCRVIHLEGFIKADQCTNYLIL
jgi:hypothetical protein